MHITTFVLLLAVPCLHAFVFDCNFQFTPSPSSFNYIYSCTAKNLHVTENDRFIDQLSGGNSKVDLPIKYVEQLIINQQNVEVLPRVISELFPRLKTLTVSSSHLKSIEPEDFLGLAELEELNLDNNEIEAILPSTFVDNSRLIKITMEHNSLRDIASNVLESLHQLNQLNLRGNECIDDRANNLEAVAVIKNVIRHKCKMPDAIEKLLNNKSVMNFDYARSGNCICVNANGTKPAVDTMIPLAMKRNATCNYYQNNNDYFCNIVLKLDLPSIQIVNFHGKHEHSKTNQDLTHAIAVNQIIRHVPPKMFEQFPNLISISITKSQLLSITTKSFATLPKLLELNLAGNDIVRVERNLFTNNKLLKMIDLSGNKIDHVSQCAFKGLDNLISLSLANNLLKTLPDKLFAINLHIETLSLDRNKLEALPIRLFEPLKKLKLLNLAENVCIKKIFEPVRKNFLTDILNGVGGIVNNVLSGVVDLAAHTDKQLFIPASIDLHGNIVLKHADKSAKLLKQSIDANGHTVKHVFDGAGNILTITVNSEKVILNSSVVSVGRVDGEGRQLGGISGNIEGTLLGTVADGLVEAVGVPDVVAADGNILPSVFGGSIMVKAKSIYLGNKIKGFVNGNGQIVIGAVDDNGKLLRVVEDIVGSLGNSVGNILGAENLLAEGAVENVLKLAKVLLTATIDEHGSIFINIFNVKVSGVAAIPVKLFGKNFDASFDASGRFLGMLSNEFPDIKSLLSKCAKVNL